VTIELRALTRDDAAAAAKLLRAACPHDRAAEVADEKLFGPAPDAPRTETFGAFDGAEPIGVAAYSTRWIRLLAVHPDCRGRGIGTTLLAAAESAFTSRGEPVARVMDQPGNYLAPGIDLRNDDTIAWLERRGYTTTDTNTNLLIDVTNNERVSTGRAAALAERCASVGYTVRRAGMADAPALVDAIGRSFSTGWAFEVERALGKPSGVHIAETADGGLAAFAAHDGNNRGLGWFGPAGTLADHRRKGLGEALLIACLADVAFAGHTHCEVAWIGPREFYDRSAGIASERTFATMRKELDD
jgi:GNAT superfamily N-acetyltransferase